MVDRSTRRVAHFGLGAAILVLLACLTLIFGSSMLDQPSNTARPTPAKPLLSR